MTSHETELYLIIKVMLARCHCWHKL